jgi:oxygen-independent coproporphyrinogen-3 oxidase
LSERPPLGAAVPLGVYIHWPYCTRICPYCDFNVVRDRGRRAEQAALAAAIVRDLQAQRRLTGPKPLVSVFIGGGTPSLMDPDWAGGIIEAARALWAPDPDLEVTLEANPTDAEAARFAAFADSGVNRLSLGVQSLDDEALAFLGRNHDARMAIAAAEAARAAFSRLSIDLIYARPGQTIADWTRELKAAVALGPEHVSPYQLTIESGTAFDRAIRRKSWAPPPEPLAADLYDATQGVLSAEGFDAYEVSNHARGPEARSRHNLLYWRGHDYVGAGPGAHGRLTLDGARTATHAHAGVGAYVAAVSEVGVGWRTRETLNPRERAEERLLTGLRTLEGVGLEELEPLRPEAARIRALSDAGLIEPCGGRLVATGAGRLVLDRLTAELASVLRDRA